MYHKISKVYGLYFITTVFLIFPSRFLFLISSRQFGESVQLCKAIVKNLLLIQSWFPTGWFNFNGVGWYLSTLLFLYLFNVPITILLQKIDSRHDKNRICIVGIGILFAATLVYSFFTSRTLTYFRQYIFPPARIGQYVSGILLGFWIQSVKSDIQDSRKTRIIFSAAEVFVLLFWFVCLLLSKESWTQNLVDFFWPNLMLLGVFLVGKGWLSMLFRKKLFVRLGDVSFECFLVHQCIIIVLPVLTGVQAEGTWEKLVCILTSLFFTFAVAFYLNSKGTARRK